MSDDLRLAALLRGSGKTLGLAESCTGGLVAARITSLAGSSAYFSGGVVAYANQVKQGLLGVPELLLLQFGAVSEEVARAMAEGARQALGCDVALSVTGIAGPDGGTTAKPVGTVYIGLADGAQCQVRQYRFGGGREDVRSETVETALNWLQNYLESAKNS